MTSRPGTAAVARVADAVGSTSGPVVTRLGELVVPVLLVLGVCVLTVTVLAVVRHRRASRAGTLTDRVLAIRQLHELRVAGRLTGEEFAREVGRLDRPGGAAEGAAGPPRE